MKINKITTFENEKFGEVRVILENEVPYFNLNDVCVILGLSNPSQVKTRLKGDGVIINEVIDNLGRKQKSNFINEVNLYKCIFQSRKEEAEQFTDWVASDVLPTIRKTGKYEIKTLSVPEMILEQAKYLVEVDNRLNKFENNISDMEKGLARLEHNQRREITSNHLTVIAYANMKSIHPRTYNASSIGKKATKLCREKGYLTGTIVDSRYGNINTYPMDVLDEVFFG